MTDQDKILQFLHLSGPTLPGKVAKTMKTEIMLASAHLADLSSQGKVKVSHLKVGGSPLYYLPGQEIQLYPFAAGNINPKDLQVLDRLKQEKVLQESKLDLLSKVALRSLQDFAVPLQVQLGDQKELFWKWSLLADEETNQRIRYLLTGISQPPAPVIQADVQQQLVQTAEHKKEEILPSPSPAIIESKIESKITEKQFRKRTIIADELLPQVEHFFKKMKIDIEQKETLRKNAEMNFLIKVPSVVGSMRYFCKAKQKSKCDERDLAAAYMEAQMKKLPLLFLYTQELNKKAEEMLESGAFENAIIKKLE